MKYMQKYPRNWTLNQKIRILGENGINSKLEHRKAHNLSLSARFGDPYGRPGDCCWSGRVGMYVIFHELGLRDKGNWEST